MNLGNYSRFLVTGGAGAIGSSVGVTTVVGSSIVSGVTEGENAAALENSRLEKFFEGADLLIYDAQYLRKEYESSRVGWGHSAIEYAIETAQRAQVKRLALFHHDPERTDAQLDALASAYCKGDRDKEIEIFFAREGMRVEI